MAVRKPAPGDLEPIETASRDELPALQLERLQWSLRARLRQRRALPQGVRRAPACTRAIAGRSPTSRGFRSPSRPTCATTIRSACSRCRASRSCASTRRPARPASRRSSATRATTSTPGPTVMARSIRAAGGRAGDIVHVAYGYGLFTGGLGAHYGAEKLGCDGDPDVRRPDREAGAADPGLQARHHHGDAVVHAGDRRGNGAAGHRPAADVARDRHLRRRAVDADDARRRSRRSSTSTRSTSTACPR